MNTENIADDIETGKVSHAWAESLKKATNKINYLCTPDVSEREYVAALLAAAFNEYAKYARTLE